MDGYIRLQGHGVAGQGNHGDVFVGIAIEALLLAAVLDVAAIATSGGMDLQKIEGAAAQERARKRRIKKSE